MIRLTSITVTDFRSIRGSITVALDAPVVLIHGQNGAGKTSLLSAIELALTGHVPSFQRVDPDYVSHLIHKEAQASRIILHASELNQIRSDADIRVTRTGVAGSALLEPSSARFYNERCFLAQATLGRLLELYEDKDTRKSDSPLTRFVKDLLGLDHLDALIDGLHDAGDVRRFRSTVPLYWETRENIPALQKEFQRLRSEITSVITSETNTTDSIEARLTLLGIDRAALTDVAALVASLSQMSEEIELQKLAGLRRNISAAQQHWQAVQAGVSANERAAAERSAAEAAAALESWRSGPGQVLEGALGTVASLLTTQVSTLRSEPEGSHTLALRAVEADLARLAGILGQAAQDDAKLGVLKQDIERAQARSEVLDRQIADHASEAGQLAKMLSDVLPHVHTDECPVCGRDFSETSSTPLHAHISARISALSESAGLLQALSRERANTISALATAQREWDVVSSRRLDPKTHDEAKTRDAALKEVRQTLIHLTKDATEGQRLTLSAQAAARGLGDLRSRDIQGTSIRETIAELGNTIALEPLAENESPDVSLERYHSYCVARASTLENRETTRRAALTEAREVQVLREKRSSLEAELHALQTRIERLTAKKTSADTLIGGARELSKRARDARTSIVRRVFDDSLNSIWRDLFVRLAPEEPFVPAFALPESPTGAVEAVLETHYRSGGKGGNPRSMLSAGNLNTAALTLFLALHLSVTPTLPWLVIDDPVQSMDEVHIAQFAALLRTLSKMHNRQVIIAVHEKPLFDYLTLELNPAFPSDRLITVEITRDADGGTLLNYRPYVWQPDPAIAA